MKTRTKVRAGTLTQSSTLPRPRPVRSVSTDGGGIFSTDGGGIFS